MNRTLKLLMFSDIFVITGFGLIEPILAIFVKDNLQGGSIFAAGIASTLFLLTKSAIQLPFSKYVDEHKDKIRWLIAGVFCMAMVPFLYMSAESINLIYLAQIIYGIGSGLAFPTWLGLWSTHLDKNHESFEWTIYSTTTSVGTALTAGIGALVAQLFGFNFTFILVGAMSLIGCFVLFGLEKAHHHKKIRPDLYHKKRKTIHRRAHH